MPFHIYLSMCAKFLDQNKTTAGMELWKENDAAVYRSTNRKEPERHEVCDELRFEARGPTKIAFEVNETSEDIRI